MKNIENNDNTVGAESGGDRSVLNLIRGIQNGSNDPSTLGINDRRLCVEHLTAEGYSVQEIAGILHTGDRTISRDRAMIRQANAIEASPELTSEMVGNLIREADTAMGRIRRSVRGNDVAPADKIEAEKSCWVINRDLVYCLQRLGYLPTAPQMIQGHLTHDVSGLEAPGYGELQQELDRLESIYSQSAVIDGNGDVIEQITEVKNTITRLVLNEQIKQISAQTQASPGPAPGMEVPSDKDNERIGEIGGDDDQA